MRVALVYKPGYKQEIIIEKGIEILFYFCK